MAHDPQPEIRSKITEDEIGGFRITIPGRVNRVGATLITGLIWVWGCGGWAGFKEVGGEYARGRALAAVIVWLVAGLVLGLFLFVVCGSMRDVVVFADQWMTVRLEFGPWSRSRAYRLEDVRNLRYKALDECSPGCIGFLAGRESGRFGQGLTEYEALRLIKTIRSRFKIPDDLDDLEPLPIEH